MSEQELRYDAFISYSRQDKVFAMLLEKALEDFKPPSGLGIPQRYLRIFRDEQDFTGPDYHSSLKRHLQNSTKLIVVCSPAACQSQYVDDEIQQFIKAKGIDHLILVLLSGVPNNEAKPGQETELAFPKALCEALGMPLAADYRGFNPPEDKVNKGRFEDSWFKTLADLYGKSRGQIEQRERKRQIHRRNLTLALSSLVLFLVFWPLWLWQKGYTVDHAALKIQSLVRSIHLKPEMQQVPEGIFRQGRIDCPGISTEQSGHEVTVKSFAIGKYEVTFDEYDRFALATGRKPPNDESWGRGRRPVVHVSWQDAKDYAVWLSGKTGQQYRLPTESEWEYAARSGGKDEIWAGTCKEEELKDFAVYDTNQTEIVGLNRRPNKLDLYDMSGNVFELLEDCWHETYEGAPSDGSAWLEVGGGDCSRRVNRGGYWSYQSNGLSVSQRDWMVAKTTSSGRGFRLAQDLKP